MIYAIEGPVAAGKTTLIDAIRQNKRFTVIEEYTDYAAANSLVLPHFPPNDEEQAKKNFEFYFNIEMKRKQILSTLQYEALILDRSIHTLLSFECGAQHYTGINILAWTKNYVKQNFDKLIYPDKVIYLNVQPEISLKRIVDNKLNTPKFFTDSVFYNSTINYFIDLNTENNRYVEFIDANKSIDNVLADVYKIMFQ